MSAALVSELERAGGCISLGLKGKKRLLFPSSCVSCEQSHSSLIFRRPQGYSLGVWEFNQAVLGHVNSEPSRRSQGGERLLQIFGLAWPGWGLGWLGTHRAFSWGCDWEWPGRDHPPGWGWLVGRVAS